MPWVIFDLKDILIKRKNALEPGSCIERFGLDWFFYNVRKGLTSTYRTSITGSASAVSKNFDNGIAYHFANYAYRGAPKEFVNKCCEEYRKMVSSKSKNVIKELKNMKINVGIITHDVRSVGSSVYDGLDVDQKNIMDNDFSWRNDRVSGIIFDEYGRPRIHDKAYALRKFLKLRNASPKESIIVAHGSEEVSMTSVVQNLIIPRKNSYQRLRKLTKYMYDSLGEIPMMVEKILT